MTSPLLQARDIVKRFPGVLAVDHLSLDVNEGEVIALLGQNGAGKSTVIGILAGLHPHGSYDGEIAMCGKPFRPSGASHAQALGVALVPQEVSVVPERSVAENMFLNIEPTRLGFTDDARRLAESRRIVAEFELSIDPDTAMGALDLATQQLVSIARALSMNARIVILDEPTASLTDHEAERLFARMRALRARGVSFIFVSHRLSEVFAIADRIVVMRDGRVGGEYAADSADRNAVVRDMLGGSVPEPRRGKAAAGRDVPALAVRDLVAHDPAHRRRPPVQGVSLSVAGGEILGLFGLLGAGCGELALAIFGAWEGAVEGAVLVEGQEVRIRHPADAIRRRIGLVAQDRRRSLLLGHSIAENIVLASLGNAHGLLDVSELRRSALDYMKRLSIKAPSPETPVGTLSGGSQQKVQVARWLASRARIFLLVDPTQGIDIGARHEINTLWQTLAQGGCALILVSSDAEELVEVCHRVIVMRGGVLAGEVAGNELREERLFRLAAGA